jgi:hypothetical protein
MLSFYLNLNKYNVNKDFMEQQNMHDLYFYKKQVLEANGFAHMVPHLPYLAPKFTETQFDEDGLELAVDVDDVYPQSLEEERAEILLRAQNIDYVRNVHKNFEHCRTRCKIMDQRLRNFSAYTSEHQMCLADCMNVRAELYTPKRPGDEKEKTFVWLA